MKHSGEYTILSILAAFYLTAILYFKSNPQYLLFATMIFGIFYVFWGIYHHLKNDYFQIKIVLEYLLVATLGVAIISTLLI